MKIRFTSFAVLTAVAVIVCLVQQSAQAADWATEISNANPLHWFRFEETGGTAADDQGSGDLDGVYSDGVGLGTPGLVGQAATFDGSSHVLLGGPSLDTDWTLEAIFQTDTVNGGASQGLMGADFTAAQRMAVKADQWNRTGQMGYTVFGVVDVTFGDEAAASPSDFAHVVLVGDASGVNVFVNGTPAGSGATPTHLDRHVLGAGAVRADGTLVDGLTGAIDELVIYDRALTLDEISSHFAAVPEPTSAGLAAIGLFGLLTAGRRRLRS